METKNSARKLKKLRAICGMSQEYLADESKVSLITIQRIENNELEPIGETMKRMERMERMEIYKNYRTRI